MAVDSTANNSTMGNLFKIKKRLTRKWMMIFIFIAVLAFFSWLIWINVADIMQNYKTYKENVAAQDAASVLPESDPRNTAADNETYDTSTLTQPQTKVDNSTIQTNIDNMKALYKPYNDILKKQKDSKDIIDEKIIAPEYDNY